MSDYSSTRIRGLLLEWREAKAAQLGLTPEHEQYCARNSIILHDIYVDNIAKNAVNIHSVNDLRRYAYYWKWIDCYGQDLFATIREYLSRPKRCMDTEEFDSNDFMQYEGYKKVRTQG